MNTVLPKLAEFHIATQHKIVEGSDYCWNCFGSNAYIVDAAVSAARMPQTNTASAVFDRSSTDVFQIEMWDDKANLQYRWTSPLHAQAFYNECDFRGAPHSISADENRYVEVYAYTDILAKITAMFNKHAYDTSVYVPVQLNPNLMKCASEHADRQQISVAEYIQNLLNAELSASILKG